MRKRKAMIHGAALVLAGMLATAAAAQESVQQTPPVENPESTVGLAPQEQPVNNMKPNVAGQVLPSAQHDTAAHNPAVAEHDRQPTLSHTFNFTPEQKQFILDALAQEQPVAGDIGLEEADVVPPGLALKPVPERIAREMPWVKPYRYAKVGSHVLLVDPTIHYVAAVIE